MPENASMPQGGPRIPMIIAGLAIAVVGGYAVGWQIGSQQAEKKSYDAGYEASKAAANAKLEAAGLIRLADSEEDSELLNVSGTVTAVRGSSFTMRVVIPASSPLDDPQEYDLEVSAGPETQIVTRRRLSEEEFSASIAAYEAARAAAGNQGDEEDAERASPPAQFEEISASLADLVVGTRVSIASAADMRGKDAVTATHVVMTEEERPEEPAAEEARNDESAIE